MTLYPVLLVLPYSVLLSSHPDYSQHLNFFMTVFDQVSPLPSTACLQRQLSGSAGL